MISWLRTKFRDKRPVMLAPYRGYGTPTRVSLFGRVLRDPGIPEPEADDTAWENLLASYERLESDEIAGVTVRGTLHGLNIEALSDDEGYFELEFQWEQPLNSGWHTVHLEAAGVDALPTQGAVLVAADRGLGMISDIDDTVMRADVANPIRLAQLILLANATTREIFPGVAAFYQALCGINQNPIFYLSGSPWNVYDLLIEVFDRHALPPGPLLLTSLERDVVVPKLLGRKVLQAHKLRQISQILTTYPAKRFVLLGDSSQHDPEIYQQVVAQFPARIAAIYIRDVTGEARDTRVIAIGEHVQALGVPFVYASDTQAFVEQAALIEILGKTTA